MIRMKDRDFYKARRARRRHYTERRVRRRYRIVFLSWGAPDWLFDRGRLHSFEKNNLKQCSCFMCSYLKHKNKGYNKRCRADRDFYDY